MAKELPYFKFEPSEYIAGNIQMCSMEAQGMFINLCSLYWIRLGYLPEKMAKQKLFTSNASALQELYDESIIKENEGLISISFLDIQLEEFKGTSEKRRDAANQRWKNKDAMQVHSKSNAIREEKRREKKREDTNTALPFSFINSLLKIGADKQLVTDWLKVRKTKKLTNTETAFKGLIKEFEKSPKSINEILTQCCENSWGGFKADWKIQSLNNDQTTKLSTSWGK
jgi:hypothetical protein